LHTTRDGVTNLPARGHPAHRCPVKPAKPIRRQPGLGGRPAARPERPPL